MATDHLWPCGCLKNSAEAHRGACPEYKTAAGSPEGCGPADGTAHAGVSVLSSGAVPARSPAPPVAGERVTPVNDRLSDELLRPIVDRFYECAKSLAMLPAGDALEQAGDLIAEAVLVAFPEWEAMRDLALDSAPTPSPAAPPAGEGVTPTTTDGRTS